MFGQTFDIQDLAVIGVLVVLEGVLSIDNALVLGLLARRLPKRLQPRALMYGLIGAFVFRVVAILTAGFLLNWHWPKLLGGLYLIYVAVKHFVSDDVPVEEKIVEVEEESTTPAPLPLEQISTHTRLFWWTVASIELTDIAFAVDSIVAAIGVVSSGPTPPGQEINPKLWLVVIGGMLGVVLMRFAAVAFIKLLEKFPRLEMSAYLLVLVIGGKLILDYIFHDRLNFHRVTAPAFWAFWTTMVLCFVVGFIPRRQREENRSQEPEVRSTR
jgi:YkoY family integral membrane protein